MTSRWPLVPLGEVLQQASDPHPVHADETYPNFGIYSFGRGLFEKCPINGATSSARTLYRVRHGQFIYSRLFAFEGAYGFVTQEFDGHFVSNEYPAFECDRKRLNPEYLASYFRWPKAWEEAATLSTGMGDRRRRIQAEQLLRYRLPLPPLSEQRRIVARIDELAAKIEESKSLRGITNKERAALIKSGRRTVLGEKPKSGWVPLRTYVSAIENGWSPPCEKRPASQGEWGVLKVGAVSFGRYEPRENKALPLNLAPRPDYQVKPGDFLMSRANTYELVGACVVVGNTPPKLMLSDKHFRFLFRDESAIDRRYLDHVLKSPALREQIIQGATGTSPTMKNISKEKVLALSIPSHDITEQTRIVAYLDDLQTKVDALKHLQAETAAELDSLLPAILDKAFKGEL